MFFFFFFSSRRRHTRLTCDWSSDVCSSDLSGDGAAIAFPRGKYHDGTLDFSFSGLKTSVARWVQARQQAGQPVPVADVAASFQEAVADVLTRKAVDACRAHDVKDL